MGDVKRYLYEYRCKKCGLEFDEYLSEEDKLKPTNYFQPEQCDVYVAPHSGIAECDIEIITYENK